MAQAMKVKKAAFTGFRQFYNVDLEAKVIFTQHVRADSHKDAMQMAQCNIEDFLLNDGIKNMCVSKIIAVGTIDKKRKTKCV